jgi:general secretion pathway protein D
MENSRERILADDANLERRFGLKTMSRILAAWMVAGVCLSVCTRTWAAPPAASSLCLAVAATSQTPLPDDSPELVRLKVIDLCKRSRQAMNEGNFETAESFLSRAEALHANFGMIYFGDSPKKVRRDLERARPAKGAAASAPAAAPAKKPSERFKPQTVNDADAQADKPREQAHAAAVKVEAAMDAVPPSTGPSTPLSDSKGYAKNYLNKSRGELAQGNLNGAVYWYQKAAATAVQYSDDEDSPQKLAADLRKAGARLAAPGEMTPETLPPADPALAGRSQFPERSPFARPMQQEPPPGDIKPKFTDRENRPSDPTSAASQGLAAASPAYPVAQGSGSEQRAQCDRLLLAARRALAVGDVRRATDATNQAKATGVKYEFHEDSPGKVEAAIYKFNELVQRPAGERTSESYRRRYAELQMQQAEDLLRWRDFDEAERLVTEAKQLGLNYGPFESNPDVLLGRIAEGRKHAAPTRIEPLPPLGATAAATVAAQAPGSGAAASGASSADAALAVKKAKTLDLVRQARDAMRHGDLDQAAVLAQSAQDLGVPDSAFGPRDDRPFLVLLKIQSERRRAVTPAQAVMPIAGTGEAAAPAAMQAVYDASNDPTRNVPAASQETIDPSGATPIGGQSAGRQTLSPGGPGQASVGMVMFQQGEEALRQHDLKAAMSFFRQAQVHREDLDPATQQRLQDHLQLGAQLPTPGRPASDGSLMKEAAAAEQVKYRQLSLEISRLENQAKQQQEKDPKRAKATLEEAQTLLDKAQLESSLRDLLQRRVTRDLAELDTYMNANRGRIELDERNDEVRGQMDREQKHKVEVQEKLALLVNEYNGLVDQKRYEEAEVVAKRAFELAPREPVVVQLKQQSLVLRRLRNNSDVKAAAEEGVWVSLHEVEKSAVYGLKEDQNIAFPDKKKWDELTMSRAKLKALGRSKRSEKEMEIEHRLKTPVSVQFKDTPLAQVLENLAKLARINLFLDQRGLSEEGVSTDTPVTIDLSEEISLKSALALVLEPLHLSYVIKDEVLKITSEQMRDGEVYTVTYNVADLVIPIPNFVPSGRMGLSGALDDAHRSLGVGTAGVGQAPLAVMASKDGASTNAMIDPNVLAQFNVPNPTGGMGGGMGGMGGGMGGPMTGMSQPFGFGPGGQGGGVQPDFDSLIELITGTIAPTTWSEVGGAGAIKQFATNLSLVISQTQEVHEEIADLLEQLRRLQDLQVTIEVRFINLSDIFYERMGIDLDLSLPSNAIQAGTSFGQPLNATQAANGPGGIPTQYDTSGNISGVLRNFGTLPDKANNSATVGIQNAFSASSPPIFSQDLSIPITDNGFSLTSPSNQLFNYAGAGMAGGATLGFAILSDIQAYFFMEAVQSDSRTNILQAPKVTLFNGQQAFVSDTAQSPFVISVIPVVGDFAAAQQPVIVVLSSGTFLSVQAVVSSDRRFVRLTVVPFFSSIGAVNTFTFTGSSSSTATSSSDGPSDTTTGRQASVTNQNQGTTVQLPTFAFTTVTTTVSVPDGGTVLLGGIKRLSEQRLENGVPILNKIPYLNRLFDNIGTGRSTSSLMMMVTPRIIIQEEEEAALGVQPGQ